MLKYTLKINNHVLRIHFKAMTFIGDQICAKTAIDFYQNIYKRIDANKFYQMFMKTVTKQPRMLTGKCQTSYKEGKKMDFKHKHMEKILT